MGVHKVFSAASSERYLRARTRARGQQEVEARAGMQGAQGVPVARFFLTDMVYFLNAVLSRDSFKAGGSYQAGSCCRCPTAQKAATERKICE